MASSYPLLYNPKTVFSPTFGPLRRLLLRQNSLFGYTSREEGMRVIQTGGTTVQPWLNSQAKMSSLSCLITGLRRLVS